MDTLSACVMRPAKEHRTPVFVRDFPVRCAVENVMQFYVRIATHPADFVLTHKGYCQTAYLQM